MSDKVKHYIFLGTGKPNQLGIMAHDGPFDDPDGQPVYVSAEDYAALKARYVDLLLKHTTPLEVNGPANVVMLLDAAEKEVLGLDALLEYEDDFNAREHQRKALEHIRASRKEAVRTIRYLEALSRGERPKWHTIKGEA